MLLKLFITISSNYLKILQRIIYVPMLKYFNICDAEFPVDDDNDDEYHDSTIRKSFSIWRETKNLAGKSIHPIHLQRWLIPNDEPILIAGNNAVQVKKCLNFLSIKKIERKSARLTSSFLIPWNWKRCRLLCAPVLWNSSYSDKQLFLYNQIPIGESQVTI